MQFRQFGLLTILATCEVMGSIHSSVAFEVCIVTGDFRADDAVVYSTLRVMAIDDAGRPSDLITLHNLLQKDDNFATHQIGKFILERGVWNKGKRFGKVSRIEIWRLSTDPPLDWYIDKIILRDRRFSLAPNLWQYFFFPVHRWVQPGQHYILHNCEALLPQCDPFPELRAAEVEERKANFVLTQRSKGFPVEVTDLPLEETFSYDNEWNIEEKKRGYASRPGLCEDYGRDDAWDSLTHLSSIFTEFNITEPQCLERWCIDDIAFGAQRLRGCNPLSIRQCRYIPANFDVVVDTLKPFMEGWTVRQILQARRLYWVNYEMLDGLACREGHELCAPMALFFANAAGHLQPLAIQLRQHNPPGAPCVFTPKDPHLQWLKAKCWFNMSDACYHMIAGRLLNHFILEGVYASMRRHLALAHPLFQLMAPHFRSLLAVNRKLKEWTFHKDGWISQNIQLSQRGIRQLLRRAFHQWKFDTHACLHRDLESRGVNDTTALPTYPYRDDALLVHRSLEAYVDRVVRLYYRSREDLLSDWELQAWRHEVATPMAEGGLGLHGVPGGRPRGFLDQGKEVPSGYSVTGLQTVEDTVRFLVGWLHLSVIVCGAALRLPMYDEYGLPANYPLSLHGPVPEKRTDKDKAGSLVQTLPSRHNTLDVILNVRLAGRTKLSRLGQFDSDYTFHPPAVSALLQFRHNLEANSAQIQLRNSLQRDIWYQYWVLDPANMSNYPGV